jgi:hypothetical protein
MASQISIQLRKGKEEILFRWWNSSSSLSAFYPFKRKRSSFSATSFGSSSSTIASSRKFRSRRKLEESTNNASYFLGVNEKEMSMLQSQQEVHFFAQDPRLFAINNDQIYVLFSNPFSGKLIRMGIALLELNKEKQELELKSIKLKIIQYHDGGNQKNWSPFFLPSHSSSSTISSTSDIASSSSSPSPNITEIEDLYLIQSINPLCVYSVKYHDILLPPSGGDIFATLVSEQPYNPDMKWNYGGIRGGTPAIYLPEYGIYLSFFHSQTWLHKGYFRTYFFGAYTFSLDKDNKYQILSYTMYPLWSDDFYMGTFHKMYRGWHVDFVVFPTSLYLSTDESTGHDIVVVTLGHQDEKGYLIKFQLKDLLENMVKVGEEDEEGN